MGKQNDSVKERLFSYDKKEGALRFAFYKIAQNIEIHIFYIYVCHCLLPVSNLYFTINLFKKDDKLINKIGSNKAF